MRNSTTAESSTANDLPRVEKRKRRTALDPVTGLPIKRTRRRKIFSCSSCRELKAKCDRQAPCGECVKRDLNLVCSLLSKDSSSLFQAGPSRTVAIAPAQSESKRRASPSLEEVGLVSSETAISLEALSAAEALESLGAAHPESSEQASGLREDGCTAWQSPRPGSEDEDEQEGQPTRTTLIVEPDGQSTFFGTDAGLAWLRVFEADRIIPGESWSAIYSVTDDSTSGPILAASEEASLLLNGILRDLPARDDVNELITCYYRHIAWDYDIAPRESFTPTLNAIYRAADQVRQGNAPKGQFVVHPHSVALLFAILGTGCVYNLFLDVNDPVAEDYLLHAQRCLALGNFMSKNTITAIQALNIMGLCYLPNDQRGDSSWPIWGLSMRLVQAAGLHRDGTRWSLPDVQVEERRRVFWEAHTTDVFQAACFSRPNTLQANQFDTRFPADPGPEIGYSTLKFQLAQLSLPILSRVTAVQQPPYREVLNLWKSVCEYERAMPFYMRCKPAWTVMVSIAQNVDGTEVAAPDITPRNLKLTYQQHGLALNCCEAVLSCLRAYFARALCQTSRPLETSRYYPSFVAVFERCIGITAITQSMHSLYPEMLYRHWNYWHHLYTASVCFSSIVMVRPSSMLAPFALSELQMIVDLFSAAPPNSRPRHSLDSLLGVYARAQERFANQGSLPMTVIDVMNTAASADTEDQADSTTQDLDHVPMLGWDTRLVRRLRVNAQTVGLDPAYNSEDDEAHWNRPPAQLLQDLRTFATTDSPAEGTKTGSTTGSVYSRGT